MGEGVCVRSVKVEVWWGCEKECEDGWVVCVVWVRRNVRVGKGG